jgi:hypothetical protein
MQVNLGFSDRFLNTVINAMAGFPKELASSLKNHSMEQYVQPPKRVILIRAIDS